MSADRHLARLQRLQRIHALLVRRQAGRLAEAEAAVHRASARLERVEELLEATGTDVGTQRVGTLSGGANLRGLLARSIAAERERAAMAEDSRRRAARQQRILDARAERIGARVAAARRVAEFAGAERSAGVCAPRPATLKIEEGLP